VPEAAASPGYRPALDGLRAVAVLSVLGYHLQLPGMRGGFLGVDIFFVLSGYLITGLLLSEHAASGEIRLARFWARRARRLLPALLLMVVLVARGIRSLRPVTEWPARAQDALWTLLYAANWHQVVTSQDYFAQWGGTSPFRHMWSIDIEEQFYLVWPLVMSFLLSRRARGWLLGAITAGALVSAGSTMLLFDAANPTRADVGTDTRAQQLLVGAALAVVLHRGGGRRRRQGGSTTGVGALAGIGVVLALVALPDALPYAVKGGLVMSLAVAAILWAIETEPGSLLARGLALRPVAWVGKVSFGLYLWHWPAILLTPTLLVRLFGGRGLQIADDRAALASLSIAGRTAMARYRELGVLLQHRTRHPARGPFVSPDGHRLERQLAAHGLLRRRRGPARPELGRAHRGHREADGLADRGADLDGGAGRPDALHARERAPRWARTSTATTRCSTGCPGDTPTACGPSTLPTPCVPRTTAVPASTASSSVTTRCISRRGEPAGWSRISSASSPRRESSWTSDGCSAPACRCPTNGRPPGRRVRRGG
jgi:peptidoglycan/LPS O-acetylase OafA/YrhL